MDRRSASSLLTWVLLPVAAYLVQSALTMPRLAYTGLALRGNLVASVDPGSPGALAEIAPGDRLVARPSGDPARTLRDPLFAALPGRPLTLDRLRGGERRPVWIAPAPLPSGERRLNAALLAMASVFVLLGGWVWSERRDSLTRAFLLACVAFACVLPPPPRWPSPWASTTAEIGLMGTWLVLPALLVHFFSSFPEARARGRRRGVVHAAYAIAAALFVAACAGQVAVVAGIHDAAAAADAVPIAAGVWFALGCLVALLLFITSYATAGSPDARRRLRVALVGSVFGLGPLAAIVAVRNVSPGTVIPGERWAAALVVLVPASFAWAIVAHRIFDFRVALRAAAVTFVVAGALTIAYGLGEWWASGWSEGAGSGLAGGALALVALTASLAGPAAPLLRSMGARLVPDEEASSLSGWMHERGVASPRLAAPPASQGDAELAESCAAVARFLRLDGCAALTAGRDDVHVVRGSLAGGPTEPGPELRARLAHVAAPGLSGVDELALSSDDQDALKLSGVAWVLPVGDPPRALLLLGRRLAGPWLSRYEIQELERFARQLAIELENVELRREASSHGALAREMREAGAVQAHLRPQRVPFHPTLDCAAAVLTTEPVGGDYYEFVQAKDRSFTLAVGDVAGHGLPAALLLAHVQAHFRTHAETGLMPARILEALNREIADFEQPEKFVGLLCARVDVRLGRVWIANAGLTPPLVVRDDGRIEEITDGGLLLGVRRQVGYTDACVDLDAGDTVVVYTDGLTEARRGDELFGTDRLREALEGVRNRRAVDVMEDLLRRVRSFADQPLDDLTVVVLRQLTRAVRPGRA